jgi:hypothetical protein
MEKVGFYIAQTETKSNENVTYPADYFEFLAGMFSTFLFRVLALCSIQYFKIFMTMYEAIKLS